MPKKRPGVILTDKQRKFCQEYVIDLHATNAATRAGYSEDSARSTASHLLDNLDIRDYVHKLQEDAFLRLRITPDEILTELARIAFSEVEDYELNARDEGEGRGTREREIQDHGRQTTDDARLADGQGMQIQDDAQLVDGHGKPGVYGDCRDAKFCVSTDASCNQENADAPGSTGATAKPRPVLSYKRVVVDPTTGSRTTITFSLQHKIMALRILGLHCGLFVKGKGKFRGDILTIIRPRGRTPEEVESGK